MAAIERRRLIIPALGTIYETLAPYSYTIMRFATGVILFPHGVVKVFYGSPAALAGGIAAKNVELLKGGRFMKAFCRKGRFADMMREMPVDIITDQKVGLRGAAEMARRFASFKRPLWD